MHSIDRAAALLMRIDRRRLAVFPDGWGDRLDLELFDRLVQMPNDPEPVDIVWGRKEEHPGRRLRRGTFTSPVSELLQPEARAVPIEVIEPASGSDRTVVLMPAWNDHGFETRRRLAHLLVDLGIGAVSFDIPHYGGRRTVPAPAQAIRTVADFAVMGYGAITEARSLLATFGGGGKTVGIAGYSMGGNLAALVSATMPVAVATAPLAASHSPGPVYLDGVLAKAIAWPALGGRDAAVELRRVLSSATALAIVPPPHTAAAVLVGARHDGFVPVQATEDLHRHWPGSELRWVDAGHATLIGRMRPLLARAIADSFDRLIGR